eukprot:4862579-Prymnesium_polylepis.1
MASTTPGASPDFHVDSAAAERLIPCFTHNSHTTPTQLPHNSHSTPTQPIPKPRPYQNQNHTLAQNTRLQ